jgi:hypothetical protein
MNKSKAPQNCKRYFGVGGSLLREEVDARCQSMLLQTADGPYLYRLIPPSLRRCTVLTARACCPFDMAARNRTVLPTIAVQLQPFLLDNWEVQGLTSGRGSSVNVVIETAGRPEGGGWHLLNIGVDIFPSCTENHPFSYPLCTYGLFPRGKSATAWRQTLKRFVPKFLCSVLVLYSPWGLGLIPASISHLFLKFSYPIRGIGLTF